MKSDLAKEKSKAQAKQAATEFNKAAFAEVNKEVTKVHHNQKVLDDKVKQLNIETSRFVKNTNYWVETYNELNLAITSLNGMEGWAASIEERLVTMTESLENMGEKVSIKN